MNYLSIFLFLLSCAFVKAHTRSFLDNYVETSNELKAFPSNDYDSRVHFEQLMSNWDDVAIRLRQLSPQERREYLHVMNVASDISKSPEERVETVLDIYRNLMPGIPQETLELLRPQVSQVVENSQLVEQFTSPYMSKEDIKQMLELFLSEQFLLSSKERRREMLWDIKKAFGMNDNQRFVQEINSSNIVLMYSFILLFSALLY